MPYPCLVALNRGCLRHGLGSCGTRLWVIPSLLLARAAWPFFLNKQTNKFIYFNVCVAWTSKNNLRQPSSGDIYSLSLNFALNQDLM